MEPQERLDPTSFIPLYFQLQEALKQKIELGVWQPGEPIPSETALCEIYKVSRTVVRQALAILEQDGQIVRTRGRGTFVAQPKLQHRVGGIGRLLAVRRPGAEIVVLDRREQPAPRRVAQGLELEAGVPTLRLMSLLRVDDAPVALFDSSFPLQQARAFARAADPRRPLELDDLGVELAHSTVAIETSYCSQWEAEQLGIRFHDAVFVTLATEHRRNGRGTKPFELARAVYRADRVQFRLELSQDGQAVPEATWEIAAAS